VPMRLGSTVIQGTRAGGGPPGEPPLAVTVDRVADGDRLIAGSLRRRDHPEESRDVWTAGPSPRRKA
jgi:hypothetical protein